ncbi:MAG: hypothetical protein J7501_14340 [Bdellovibrio sp.]|nr:hypothetical protein [Bdellovibrio sp.]
MKKICIVLFTLFSISAFAKVKPAAKIDVKPFRVVSYFKYSDKAAGKSHKESLHVHPDTVYINHDTIPKASWKKGEAAMKVVSNPKPTNKMYCPQGMYSLKVSKNEKKSVTESGCITSPRFKEIQTAFATLNGLVAK